MVTAFIAIILLIAVNLYMGEKILKAYEKKVKEDKEHIREVDNNINHCQRNANKDITENPRQKERLEYIEKASDKKDSYTQGRKHRKRRIYKNPVPSGRVKTAFLKQDGKIKVGFRSPK